MSACRCCNRVYQEPHGQHWTRCGACRAHASKDRKRGVVTKCRHGRGKPTKGTPGTGRVTVLGD